MGKAVQFCRQVLESLPLKCQRAVVKLDLRKALYLGLLVKKTLRVDVPMWLSYDAHQGEDRPVIAAPEFLMRPIVDNLVLTRRVVLHEDTISVRWALIFFVDKFIRVRVTFIRRHEGDLVLLVVRENLITLPQ